MATSTLPAEFEIKATPDRKTVKIGLLVDGEKFFEFGMTPSQLDRIMNALAKERALLKDEEPALIKNYKN